MDEYDKEVVTTWEDVWGSDAIYDIATDLEDTYEESVGKSAVYWESYDKDAPIGCHDELAGRPDEYVTCGYTSDFESWGIDMSTKAIESGCKSVNGVMNYIIDNSKKKNN